MRLTSSQKQKIQTFYDYLCKMAGGEPVTAQKAAKAIQAYGGSLDYDYTLGMCERIQTGIEEMYRLCQDKESLEAPDFVQRMLDDLTGGMEPQQRKGFFLQCLDAFEQYPKSAPEMAARAALPEEALKNLLALKLDECAKPSVVQMADALTDPFFQEQSERAFDHTIGCKADAGSTLKNEAMAQKADAFFFAAAEYMASLHGVLPMEFGMVPELLGTCAAAQTLMAGYAWESAFDAQESCTQVMDGIVSAAIGAAFAASAAALGITASPLLETLAFSGVGMLVGVLLAAALYLTAVMGSVLLVGKIAQAVRASAEKWSRKKTDGDEQADFLKQEAEWSEQEDFYDSSYKRWHERFYEKIFENMDEKYQEGMA